MPKRVLQVYSHQRSGTHLLMEGLDRHFYPKRNLLLKIGNARHRRYSDGTKTSKKKGPLVKGGKLFASHQFPESCKWSKKNAVYIRRDGFDVLHSFYRLRVYTMDEKPSFDEWLTEKRIRHWVLHVSKWMATGVYVVHFENLSTDYDGEMRKIAKRFKFEHPRGGYAKPGPVGWNPGKGAIGQGIKHWSKEKKVLLEQLKKEFDVD